MKRTQRQNRLLVAEGGAPGGWSGPQGLADGSSNPWSGHTARPYGTARGTLLTTP